MSLPVVDEPRRRAPVLSHSTPTRYQRQLPRQPDLAGKLTVRFAIAADGSVSRAEVKSTSLGSPEVESCVVDRFYAMQFPRLRGGGMAVVSYPFLFSAG